MRNVFVRFTLFVILISILTVIACSCIHISERNISNSKSFIQHDFTQSDSELPAPTEAIDYTYESNTLIDTDAILSAVKNSSDGVFPTDMTEFGYIFNRYYISKYADTNIRKSTVLGMYTAMLTSQPEYVFADEANISTDDFATLMTIIRSDTPEFMHVKDEYTRYSDSDSGTVHKVAFKYNCTPKQYYDKLDSTLSIISDWQNATEASNQYEKELYVYNRIIDNCVYTIDEDDTATAYGAIVLKRALCEGYSDALTLSMFCMGIDCIQVCGNATNSKNVTQSHAWNYVKLNDSWYATDITWDDYSEESKGSLYAYMNITDSEISLNHTVDSSLSEFGLPKCSAKSLNYHRINGNIAEADTDIEEFFIDKLNTYTENMEGDLIGFSLKFENKADYNSLIDNLDTWLHNWNRNRSNTYISKYKYSYDNKMCVIRFTFETAEI